ncbi:MAG: FAD-dependent oxidoreductase [Candidatus Woesearchaeota archaeon]
MAKRKVAIIGAGPAGLGAAYYFACNSSNLDVTVIDQGKIIGERNCCKDCQNHHCNPCYSLSGLGGAGGFTDGKLNFHPTVGGRLNQLGLSNLEANHLMDEIYHGMYESHAPVPFREVSVNLDEERKLLQRADELGIRYIPLRQKHIGSDNLPTLMNNLFLNLVSKGIQFRFKTKVEDILLEGNTSYGIVTSFGQEHFDAVILCPGRAGHEWVIQLAEKYNITHKFNEVDIGIRVEIPESVYRDIVDVNYDPKFVIHLGEERKVRTFCTNPKGFVVYERYPDIVGVNGHSFLNRFSSNTNFALLNSTYVIPTEGENSYSYAKNLAKKITGATNGRILLQKIGDLRSRKTSVPYFEKVIPSLTDVCLMDLNEFYPTDIVENLLCGLELLDRLVPGVNDKNNLVYAPEIKYRCMRVLVGDSLESSVKNLYFAGDGAGLSGDLLHSSVTGWLAGKGVDNHG